MWKCKHCKQEFNFETTSQKANHSRWCDLNPKKKEYIDKLKTRDNISLMNEAKKKSGITNQFTSGKQKTHSTETIEKIRVSNIGKTHTDETKKIISEKALKSTHRRLVKNVTEYTKIDGSIVNLDSSWEVALAKRLDSIGIDWVRPEHIPWIDGDGVTHNYFPDFYIPSKDIFLDPKNEQAFKVQRVKIDILNETYNNIIWIKTLEECENFSI